MEMSWASIIIFLVTSRPHGELRFAIFLHLRNSCSLSSFSGRRCVFRGSFPLSVIKPEVNDPSLQVRRKMKPLIPLVVQCCRHDAKNSQKGLKVLQTLIRTSPLMT
jgi:hypothetical protein